MIRGIGVTLSEAIRCESDQLGLGINQEHLLRPLLLLSEAAETTEAPLTALRFIFLRHRTVEDTLCLCLVIDSCIVSPAVRGEDQGSDKIQFTIAGCPVGITRAIGFTAPGKIALTVA